MAIGVQKAAMRAVDAPSPTTPTSLGYIYRYYQYFRRRCICWCRRWVGNSAASTQRHARGPAPAAEHGPASSAAIQRNRL